MSPSEVLRGLGRPIAYYPRLAPHVGGVKATLFLCQLFYWSDKGHNDLGVYKSCEEWEEETGLSYREQASARKTLVQMGLIRETHKRLEHKIYYHLDLEAFDALLLAIVEKRIPRNAESAIGGLAKAHFVLTENTTESTSDIKPTADPLDAKTDPEPAADIDPTLPADYPREYPGPASKIFAAWRAYAVAFRERYKQWPTYNVTVAGIMGKAVVRIQDATPAAATHYVKHEKAPSIVDKFHPVTVFLKHCEAYKAKVVEAEQSKKRADKAAAALREAEQASASAPQANENTKSIPSPASTGAAALSALKTRVGIPSK